MSFEQAKDESKERLAQVKVIIWDLDGTLYQDAPGLSELIRSEIYKRLAKAMGVSVEEAQREYDKKYQEVEGATKTLETFGLNGIEIVDEVFERIDFSRYLKKNPKLPVLFASLASFRHILLTNNRREHALKKLEAIGLDPAVFEEIICTYDLGIFKPDRRVFELVLEKTGLPPNQHLYVGDQEKKDIVPAKAVGMRTAMVWGNSEMADISLPTVYDIVGG